MRRVKEFFSYQVRFWNKLANNGRTEGHRAYASRQAAIREAILSQCEVVWKDIPRYMLLGIGAEEEE
jgi:hypothetical protein